MYTLIRLASFTSLLILFLLPLNGNSQAIQNLEDGYYCVVGTFRFINNAVAYRQSLSAKGYSARIGKDPLSGLHYVHLGKAPAKTNAISTALAMREKSEFKDAWVKTVGEQPLAVNIESDSKEKEQLLVSQPIQPSIETAPKAPAEFEISNTEVFLHLYNAANDKMIDGTVEVIDTERSRLIDKTKGNDYYVIPDPKSNSKRVTLIGNVFGYRKVQNEISYPIGEGDQSNPNLEMVGTIMMIRFDMVRYVKGDINVLYNVYFYHDAAVMQPESKYELNNLLDMLIENPKYRIKLHGHTNGGHTGKYFYPGDDHDLFNMAGAKEGFATAKVLAAKRAEVIKEFLVSHGINGDRIEIKSWGGKKPLYDKGSENAKRNLRVEVEILEM
jgi:outer membrane protein OmpA-like peptidoglycan-associated protein